MKKNVDPELSALAHSFDCLLQSELQTLTGWSDSTCEAYRKRGVGPASMKIGKTHLYKRSAVLEFMEAMTKAPKKKLQKI